MQRIERWGLGMGDCVDAADGSSNLKLYLLVGLSVFSQRG